MVLMQWIIGPQLVGAIMLFSGYIQKIFPPKDIDGPYGYRTATSKQNQQTFDEGNRYSAKLLIKTGLIAIIAGLIITPFFNRAHEYIMAGLLILTGISIAVTVTTLTEKHLRQMFDDINK